MKAGVKWVEINISCVLYYADIAVFLLPRFYTEVFAYVTQRFFFLKFKSEPYFLTLDRRRHGVKKRKLVIMSGLLGLSRVVRAPRATFLAARVFSSSPCAARGMATKAVAPSEVKRDEKDLTFSEVVDKAADVLLMGELARGIQLGAEIAAQPSLTINYPFEKGPLSPRFRGEHALPPTIS